MFKKKDMNVSPADKAPSKRNEAGMASPGIKKIQEMISARASNSASHFRGKKNRGARSAVKLKASRPLNLKAGEL